MLILSPFRFKADNSMRNIAFMRDELSYIPDALFPTDNDFEVPSLRLDMQATCCEIPFVCFGEQKRTFKMNGGGTLHFYTDDYRFSSIFEHPEKDTATQSSTDCRAELLVIQRNAYRVRSASNLQETTRCKADAGGRHSRVR